jgi:hypothetical protein
MFAEASSPIRAICRYISEHTPEKGGFLVTFADEVLRVEPSAGTHEIPHQRKAVFV